MVLSGVDLGCDTPPPPTGNEREREEEDDEDIEEPVTLVDVSDIINMEQTATSPPSVRCASHTLNLVPDSAVQSDVSRSLDHGKMPSTVEFGESQSKGVSCFVTNLSEHGCFESLSHKMELDV